MSQSGGRRRAVRERPDVDLTAVALEVLGTLASAAAWAVLVAAAIDFGATAQDGRGSAWFFLALASLGAMACLLLALVLGTRLLTRAGLLSGYRPKRARRRH